MIRLGVGVAAFVVGTACLFLGFRVDPPPHAAAAPSGKAAAIRTTQSTVAVVLAFIDTSDATANRSQALVIRSIQNQFERRGLRVVVVQAGEGQTEDERRNVRYDWGLDRLTVLADPSGRLAAAYSIQEYPSTLLLDDLGEAIETWEGYSPPAIVGPVLERVMARPLSVEMGQSNGIQEANTPDPSPSSAS